MSIEREFRLGQEGKLIRTKEITDNETRYHFFVDSNDLDIRTFRVVDGKVVSLTFSHRERYFNFPYREGARERVYEANVTPDEISIGGVGKINRQTRESLWYIRHVCNMQGFGYSTSDNCDACENDGVSSRGSALDNDNYLEGLDGTLEQLSEYMPDLEKELRALYGDS